MSQLCPDCDATSSRLAWVHCCIGIFLGYQPPPQSAWRNLLQQLYEWTVTPFQAPAEKEDWFSEQLWFACLPLMASAIGVLICILVGAIRARQKRWFKPSARYCLLSPFQSHGVVRNSWLVGDTVLSCSGFVVAALLPDGLTAFNVFSSCCAVSACSWTLACHFDWSKTSLFSLFIAVCFPATLYRMDFVCRQHVAVALFGVSLFKLGLIGGLAELVRAAAMQGNALKSGAYGRKSGILWLYCCVRRKI